MNLVIFDIDGTLTDTNPVDERCFKLAIRESLGLQNISSDWSQYRESTDSGIFRELFHGSRKEMPKESDLENYQRVFKKHLEAARAESINHFQTISGINSFLDFLPKADWCISIATGAFRMSAEFKLKSAELWGRIPVAAFSDDSDQRAIIVKTSWNRALEAFGHRKFERVLYVGDGQWDLKAARELGIPYVGLNRGEKAERLKALGASHVFEDYQDHERFLKALYEAEVPKQGSI